MFQRWQTIKAESDAWAHWAYFESSRKATVIHIVGEGDLKRVSADAEIRYDKTSDGVVLSALMHCPGDRMNSEHL